MMGYLTDEVGIDGMLVAPGYQYSQIDPALTMTRAEHEEKFRVIRSAARKERLPLAGEPDLPGLPHRRAQAGLRAVGLDHAQPVRLEGPVLPAHRRDLPDLRGAAGRDRVGGVRPGQRRALRALRDPLRLRALGRLRGDRERQGDRPQRGMDADGVTFACATAAELRVARRSGVRSALVGLGARNGAARGAAGLVRARGRFAGRPRSGHRGRRDAGRRRRGHGALGGRAARRSRRASR